ncbi:hypothetical protein BBP40_010254 [Aspergillus hancockii]|nr:hypothetical protein BBP40_010254 [Aspergillus hancockii]
MDINAWTIGGRARVVLEGSTHASIGRGPAAFLPMLVSGENAPVKKASLHLGIMARQHCLNEKHESYDEDTGVKYMVYDETQWITYDDAESFAVKRKMLDDECFGGVMIWAIDQDTPDFQALSGLLGDQFMSDAHLEGGELSDEEKKDLGSEMGGLTGDACYVPTGCFGAEPTIEGYPDCRSGDVSIGMTCAKDRYADKLGETKCSSGSVSYYDAAPELQDYHRSPYRDLPFVLKKIFTNPIGEDIAYRHTDKYGNNDRDPNGPDETDVGDDPCGFIVLDGDQDPLQGEFPSDFEFTHAEDGTRNPIKKRETPP